MCSSSSSSLVFFFFSRESNNVIPLPLLLLLLLLWPCSVRSSSRERALYVVVNGSPSAVLWKSIFCSLCQCVSGCVHGGAFGVYLSQNKVRRRVEENLPQNGRKITRPFSGFIFYLGVGLCVSLCVCVCVRAHCNYCYFRSRSVRKPHSFRRPHFRRSQPSKRNR